MSGRKCVVAYEPCGCTAWIEVLGHGNDPGAYREAARHAQAGFVIDMPTLDDWKTGHPNFYCDVHSPDGPPWWKSNGGNGKRPAEFAVPTGLGL